MNVYQTKPASSPNTCRVYRVATFFGQPLGDRGQSYLTHSHDQCCCREPEHNDSGKYLVLTMYNFQFDTNLLYVWGYPFLEIKRFHTRVIEPNAFRKGTSSELRVGLVLLLQLLTLITVAYAHNPQPVVDLQTGYNNYAIHFGQRTFQMTYDNDGIVMTHSDLVRRHQLMSISRVLDYTDIAVANAIVKSSLSAYTQTTTHDNFTWIQDKIYHISPQKCYCLSYPAHYSKLKINTRVLID